MQSGYVEASGEAIASLQTPLYPHTTESPTCIDRTLADLPCPKDAYVIWPN
jgi:hypothetical protein